ncbi:MAG TPA: DUF6585 family protein [Streptosporangiaceae bacterium]|jgi:hypothetical protein
MASGRGSGVPGKLDPAALGAEYRLGEYERTHVIRYYSPKRQWSRTLGWIMLPAAIVLSPVAVVALLSSDPAAFATGLILAPALTWVGAAGAWQIWRARPERVDQILVYAGGVIQLTSGEPGPRVVRWDDAASLSVRIVRPDGSDPYIGPSTVRDGAGSELTTRGPVLAAVLAPRVVPALLGAFDAGEPVSFGPVRIDRQGITAPAVADGSAPRLMAWTDMRRITIDARTRIGIRTVEPGRDFLIDLDGIPNGLFACHIIERGAAGADVPVGYQKEKRLPPRDIAGLTAG